eukprot:TRINITY_DN2299_c0_g1_i1.p1 TRINITY_DN2299_c0_g1~~TRINITY_DN2299_c0_g1_i1.p1  ORF type:complete len:329 (-),score=46.26 TRINITY_DN2299_c0_g1_i1:869-1855(-)
MRVGLYLSQAKLPKFEVEEFIRVLNEDNSKLILLDLESDLEAQGPFDVIVHKVTDELVDSKNKNAEEKVKRLESYLDKHPEIIDIDPVRNQRTVLDRGSMSLLLAKVNNLIPPHLNVRCPKFTIVDDHPKEGYHDFLKKEGVKFPVLCKTVQACGSRKSHIMGIVFEEKSLLQFEPPILIQEYINHNATLFKVFAIGDYINVVRRKSIRNLLSYETEPLIFDSQKPFPPNLSSDFVPSPPPNAQTPTTIDTPASQPPDPPLETLKEISAMIRTSMGLTLLGFDVITEKETGTHAIVDINYFPGYVGVPNFHHILLNHIKELLKHYKAK